MAENQQRKKREEAEYKAKIEKEIKKEIEDIENHNCIVDLLGMNAYSLPAQRFFNKFSLSRDCYDSISVYTDNRNNFPCGGFGYYGNIIRSFSINFRNDSDQSYRKKWMDVMLPFSISLHDTNLLLIQKLGQPSFCNITRDHSHYRWDRIQHNTKFLNITINLVLSLF